MKRKLNGLKKDLHQLNLSNEETPILNQNFGISLKKQPNEKLNGKELPNDLFNDQISHLLRPWMV